MKRLKHTHFALLSVVCAVLFASLSSCSEYDKILKSTDIDLKYTYAKKYYEEKKYSRTYTLLQDLQAYLKGTAREEESLFLLAQSFFYDKDYVTAPHYYMTYVSVFPKGQYAEICRYQSAYSLYLDSPEPELDQTTTVSAMQQFQSFLEYYPRSVKADSAMFYMFQLQEKLAYKELLACRLYFNLGNYLGNNYESCVITAREALKSYPHSVYADEMQYLIVRSRYELAMQSVAEKVPLRLREVVDEYYNYKNMFPDGKFIKDVERFYASVTKQLKA